MRQGKPDWLKVRLQGTEALGEVRKLLDRLSLNTVCEEAKCPNIMECFNRRTATFMILGNICTRNCTFCNVTNGQVKPVDPKEPSRIACAARDLKLRHAVVTSVTRDDLPDGGAGHFAAVIKELQEVDKNLVIEVLIPDFQGDDKALFEVIKAKPHIINHNMETVPRLYPAVRPQAEYHRSLKVLKNIKEMGFGILTKSGIMLGLGEEKDEVVAVLQDLRSVDCDLLTIGQYLAPSDKHHPVVEYVHPDIYNQYREIGMKLGFKYVASAPLVRSSYHAEQFFQEIKQDGDGSFCLK